MKKYYIILISFIFICINYNISFSSSYENMVISANYLANEGIIGQHSYDPENYKLEQNVLRQEIAAVARGVAGLSKKSRCDNIFSDLLDTKPNSWACVNVEVLVDNNLISRNSTFRPEYYITKSEALGMMIKAGGYNYDYNSLLGTSWQTQLVNYAVEEGIILRFYDYNTNATRGWVFEVAYSIKTEEQNINETEEQNIVKSSYDSPFGILDPVVMSFEIMKYLKMSESEYFKDEANNLKELAIKYGRKTNLLMWDFKEPILGGGYDWSHESKAFQTDNVLSSIFNYLGNDFNLILSIRPARSRSVAYIGNDSEMETSLKDFIKASVERYNGDGVNDYDSNIKVKYWQAENEPFIFNAWINEKGGTIESYARYVEILSESVKSVDSEAKIVLGAEMTSETNPSKVSDQIKQTIELLKGKKSFDVVDIHYWFIAEKYKMDIAADMRKILDDNGYEYVEIWSCEHGTYTNDPTGHLPNQSETEQAISLIKRYVYNLSNNVDKIFWNKLVDFNCYGKNNNCGGLYDNIGLISDGVNSGETENLTGVKRLAYYSHVLLADKLNNVDWNNIEIILEGEDDVYAYKFSNGVYIVWTDADSKTLDLSKLNINGEVKITESVQDTDVGLDIEEKDYLDYFNIYSTTNIIKLSEIPVFMEVK